MKRLYSVLNYKNLHLYQDDEWFCFSLDSVILGNFSTIKLGTKNIAELGTGNAIVSLILSQRTKAHIDAIEIQQDVAELALENVKYNKLENQISVINEDMKVFCSNHNNYDKYDMVVCNPPYFKVIDNRSVNLDVHKAIARHEIKVNISEVIASAWSILKEGGIFSMVYGVERFCEILFLFSKQRFEVKYIRFIHDRINLEPCLFYIEATKLGRPGLKIDKPFILRNEDESFTDEYLKIQNGVIK